MSSRRAVIPPIPALATLACLALAVPVRAASDFHFTLPPGWRDIGPGSHMFADNIPQPVMGEALSGRFLAYYVEPRDTESVNASFNALTNPETGRITAAVLEKSRSGIEATTGGDSPKGIDWERAFFAGGLGGLAAGLFGLVNLLRSRGAKQGVPPSAAGATVPGGWQECPSCHRRVPGRIATCRCGRALTGQ